MLDRRPYTAKPTISFAEQISTKAARKIKAKRYPTAGVWFGLGMMGLIGWSVVVPTLIGAAIGLWLDNRHPGSHSWTLAMLVAGLAVGCITAGYWVAREDKAMGEDNDE